MNNQQQQAGVELSDCPFCGGPAKVSSRPGSPNDDSAWFAFISCMCGGYSSCAHKMGGGDTQEEAIRQATLLWNARAADRQQRGKVEPGAIQAIISDIRAAETMARRDQLFDQLLGLLESPQAEKEPSPSVIRESRTTEFDGAQSVQVVDAGPPYHFHRYVGGKERAEDVLIEKATTLKEAMKAAATLCPERPMTVLVHAAPQQSSAQAVEPSPTSGMNMAQRITHAGGRNLPGSTYVEFGSIQAVEALVGHALRDAALTNALPPEPLTVEQLKQCHEAAHKACDLDSSIRWSETFARLVEAAHGIMKGHA